VVGWWSLTRYLPTAPARISAIKQQSAESTARFYRTCLPQRSVRSYPPKDWFTRRCSVTVASEARFGVSLITLGLKVSSTSVSRVTACAVIRTDMQT